MGNGISIGRSPYVWHTLPQHPQPGASTPRAQCLSTSGWIFQQNWIRLHLGGGEHISKVNQDAGCWSDIFTISASIHHRPKRRICRMWCCCCCFCSSDVIPSVRVSLGTRTSWTPRKSPWHGFSRSKSTTQLLHLFRKPGLVERYIPWWWSRSVESIFHWVGNKRAFRFRSRYPDTQRWTCSIRSEGNRTERARYDSPNSGQANKLYWKLGDKSEHILPVSDGSTRIPVGDQGESGPCGCGDMDRYMRNVVVHSHKICYNGGDIFDRKMNIFSADGILIVR